MRANLYVCVYVFVAEYKKKTKQRVSLVSEAQKSATNRKDSKRLSASIDWKEKAFHRNSKVSDSDFQEYFTPAVFEDLFEGVCFNAGGWAGEE